MGNVMAAALIFDYTYLFICSLFNDAESSSGQIVLIALQVKDNILQILIWSA
jgi:hypothetical protein